MSVEWPCLVKPAQRYIACFETLAQLALLQATLEAGATLLACPLALTTRQQKPALTSCLQHVGLCKFLCSLSPLGRMPKTSFRRFEQESPRAFRPPPGQSCVLQPYQPCASWKGGRTLPRRVTMAPRTSGCSRRACVKYGLRKPVWLATAPRARLLHFALRGFSAARIPSCDGRVCAQTPSIRKRTDESRCIEGSAMPSHCLSLCFVPPQVQPH